MKPVALFLVGLILFGSAIAPAGAAAISQAAICNTLTKAVATSGDGFAALKGPARKAVKGWMAKTQQSADFACAISVSDQPPSPTFWCRTGLSFGETQLSVKSCFPAWNIQTNDESGSWTFAFSNPKSRAVILISPDPDHATLADINIFLAK